MTPGGPPERPYDVAGWTLPAQMGIDVRTIEHPFELAGDVARDDGGHPAGEECGANAHPATTSSTHGATAGQSPPTGCSPPD